MDAVVEALLKLLIDWGYLGLFASAFLAGSIIPFSSELVMMALVGVGLSPVGCVLSATLGNTAGGMTCYYLGRLGKTEWISRYLKVKPDKLARTERFLQGKGALMGFFTFLPFVGEAIAVALGFMRSNLWLTTLSMGVGKAVRYAVMLLAMTSFMGCGGGKTAGTQADEAKTLPLLTVTVEPLRYFTQAIAGNRFHVVSMVPKGSSPETYDPTPRQLVEVSRSSAYLRIGHIGFEQVWMERIAQNAPRLRFFDTSKGIDLIRGEGHRHRDGTRHAGGVEPHVWNSPRNAAVIATNIFSALCTLDTLHTAEYRRRCDSLLVHIRQTDSLLRRRLSSPRADRAFMIYHPALSYFARDYGLRQLSIEEGGKEPAPAHLAQLIETARRERVRVIFIQPEFDRRHAELIARQTGTRVVDIHPLSYRWSDELLRTAEALVAP
ncbi:MAG: zinc ABC transporter substrate-binding protein [Prevotellaceae bacterium]|jgi:ABC-type Zn uptake system ZnuABC Zn-binding protein ZnuA|nr:zinc ABC transporter substrate-binding protein [Prevotellaceae bacterium]